MGSQPFWSSVLRATRLGSASVATTKKKSSSPSSASPLASPGLARASVPKPGTTLDISEPAGGLAPLSSLGLHSDMKAGHFIAGSESPLLNASPPLATLCHPESDSATPETLPESFKPALHPAVSKLVAFEMDGDLSTLKKAGTPIKRDPFSDDDGSSDTTATLEARQSSGSIPGSRRGSVGSSTGTLSRRRVSFAPSPSMVVSFDARDAPAKCIEKQMSLLDESNSKNQPQGGLEGADLTDGTSVIAPAADELSGPAATLDMSKQEEEDARVAAKIRAKQMRQLEAARKGSIHQQQLSQQLQQHQRQEEDRQRRSSWARAFTANALAMGGGMGPIITL
ncbi:uncharacterized protein SPPG_03739 [Spizellomyces punctatus DAOM BR117]|uniref:Uncharacterized protein n=1 Tax=Spizellomyces punctatus (strain DAOM BR117) TaxID=645134 RepID=A0A0L0HHQ3_SPIPD|nr:uncharacterized protein SPPG_03739 [Spizellomyces punctatus DAOM BR117]KND00612.1 hypothetical protein SPPG_03739 [Spizellomyces punctatus DAOM BR117]|eukprot:XP_016608651.1 hypothetical protein SPPG_03739 [Spizellomyces punctatus DAOM BR117]